MPTNDRIALPFVMIILLSALPYGSARAWGWLLVLGCLCLYGGFILWRQPQLVSSISLPLWRLPVILGGLALIGAMLQWLPFLPDAVNHPLWAQTANVLQQTPYRSISLNPEQSALFWLRMVAYALLLFVSIHLFRQVQHPERLLYAIIVATAAYAVYGLFTFALDSQSVLFTRKWTHQADLTSTFMNRNNYATFAGIGFIVSLGVMLEALRVALRPERGWRQQVRSALHHVLQGRVVLLLLATSILFASVLLSHSRAGIMAMLAGGFVITVLVHRRWLLQHKALAGVIIMLALGVTAMALQNNPMLWGRLMHTDLEREHRLYVYERSVEIVRQNPWLGSGLNTFLETYRLHNAPPVDRSYDRALNVYLDMAVEHGLIGTVLILVSLLWLVVQCGRGYQRRRQGRLYPALGLACSVQVALHSGFDASLHVPAVALLYSVILGLAVGQSLPSGRQQEMA